MFTLQANTIINTRASLSLVNFYSTTPELKDLKLSTAGKVFVSIPIGHLSFLGTHKQTVIIQLQEEFVSIIEYPYA